MGENRGRQLPEVPEIQLEMFKQKDQLECRGKILGLEVFSYQGLDHELAHFHS